MNPPLRMRLFFWLVVALCAVFAIQTVGWFLFEMGEWLMGEQELMTRELAELAVLQATNLVLLPLMLALFWWITKRMLRPLTAMAGSAERIRAGAFDERIQTPNTGDEIEVLARAINSAFDRYQDAVNRLQRFSGDASHQLRTPLTALRTTGEVCLQRERSPAEYREALEAMLQQGQKLSRTAEQLLLLARLDEADVCKHFQQLDLAQVVSAAVEPYTTLAQDHGQRLHVALDERVAVHGNEALLQQVVANLLDNALRLTPRGGVIRVAVQDAGDRGAVVTVEDNGPGIPADSTARVFERFGRVTGRGDSGSGLGLAIVADVVRAHHGTIALDSTPGHGARFTVTLPPAPTS